MFQFLTTQRVVRDQGEFPPIEAVIKTFWGEPSPQRRLFNRQLNQSLDMTAYAEYVRRQWHAMAADADGRHVATQEMDDLFHIVRLLIQGHERDVIVSQLNQIKPTASEGACSSSIDLAVRLLLMLKVGVVRHQTSPHLCLKWDKGDLQSFVREQFNKAPVLDYHHIRLPKSFDIWSISAIGGLKVEFTDNLADYLLLVDDDRTVLLFYHASFLECQEKLDHPSVIHEDHSPDQRSTIYSTELVDETLQTLALLSPQSEFSSRIRGNKTKREWFQKLCMESRECVIDCQVALCGNLRAEDRQLERFTFWRDRLIILKQVYDDATPKTFQQWWYDRRNGERWSTFWVAVLVLMITIMLGLIQCIESALQVYKAYYPTVV